MGMGGGLTCAVPEDIGSAASPDDDDDETSAWAALVCCLLEVLRPRRAAGRFARREVVAVKLRRAMREVDIVCNIQFLVI